MNIVVVNSEFPYPPTAGNRIRTLNLLTRLADRHRITFIARRTDLEETRQAVEYLGDHRIQTITVDHPIPSKHGISFYARLAANLISPWPYSVSSHGGHTIRRAVREFASKNTVHLWQAESTPYIRALRDLSNVHKLIVAHNVESLIWQRYYETELHPLKRWYIYQQWRKYERFERQAFAEARRIVAVSPDDANLIRKQFGKHQVDVVDNGIDRAYFEAVRPDRDPKRILFLGSLSWRPNLDAVNLLLDQIFPLVRAEEPLARLCLVGRHPPEGLLRRIQAMEAVELHADVPDVRPFLGDCGVMTVPLRIGGGSRLKILESLATGLPVVSTKIGAEGLELTAGQDFVQADDPQTMALALIDCIRNPAPALAMAERGRRFVLDRYDWDTLATKLEQVWENCLEDRSVRAVGSR